MPGSGMQPGQSLIAMEDICQSYRMGEQHLPMLDNTTLTIRHGESCAFSPSGQRQRVAITHALVGESVPILAGESTSNLDGDTAQDIMDPLLELNRTQAVTLVMVTHDIDLALRLDRRQHHQQRSGFDG
ncbi:MULTISPECIES: hypothetical protein [Pseudomonadaceae]|uniref:hypothetical protein n=1 Tax=Pseudomonadaceae TaxID=135621 RepID=UPI0015E34A65|nr:hypothetical protein [Stutzerimonas stutzeri]